VTGSETYRYETDKKKGESIEISRRLLNTYYPDPNKNFNLTIFARKQRKIYNNDDIFCDIIGESHQMMLIGVKHIKKQK